MNRRKHNETMLRRLLSYQTDDETLSIRSQANRGGFSTSSHGNLVDNIAKNLSPSVTNDQASEEQLLFGSAEEEELRALELLEQQLLGESIADEPPSRFHANREGFTTAATSFLENQRLLNLPRPPINQPTTNTSNADKSALLWRKLDFSIQMITSLGSVNDVDAIEADIRYNHLTSLYQSFVSNVDEIMHLVPSTGFNRLIKVAKETQQRVISIQVSLKKIMLNDSPSSTASKADDQTNRTVIHDIKIVSNSPSSTSCNRSIVSAGSEQNDLGKSDSDQVVTKKARTDAAMPTKQMLKPDRSTTAPSNTTGDSTRKNIEPGKSNDEPTAAETAQRDDLANKTKSTSLNDTFSKSMETDDQANQTKQAENDVQIILACVAKQKQLLKEIKLLESLRGPRDWKMDAQRASSLRQSFILNQNEFEKYLNPSQLKLEQDYARKYTNKLVVLEEQFKWQSQDF
ncbi:uncharacterized protein LOC135843798 [Planococcus citri]|uniref:uncharacterized protein LOC135843798 n=1 Tax=Planococcus citri TaxID=170843 RepID=UPI0031F9C3A2